MGDLKARGTWTLVATIIGSSLSFIDQTAVNVALPVLQRDLHSTFEGTQWVIESYSLFFSALMLLGGALGDAYGRRAIYALGIGIFAAASLACAFAPNLDVLIAARCIQGAGAALATPLSLAIISATFEGEERGRAIGTWSGFGAIMAAVGPVLGGVLVQYATWRYVFFINLPLSAIVLFLLVRYVGESRDPHASRSIDITGAALATLGLGALVYGLIDVQQAWTPLGLGTIVAGAVLLVAFVFAEKRERHPMMPLELFRVRRFSLANLYTFVLYAALGGSLYFVPFDLINVQHYPPAVAGAALLPFIAVMFALSRFSGGLAVRVGPRVPLFAGALLAAAGFTIWAFAGTGRSYWVTFFPGSTVLGFGGALFVAPLTTAVMDALDTAYAGIASGISYAVARVSGLVAIAAIGIAVAQGAARGGYAVGFEHAMLISAGLSVVAALIALDGSFRALSSSR